MTTNPGDLNPDQLKEMASAHHWPPLHPVVGNMVVEQGGAMVITRGQGVWLEDDKGRRFFDVMAGLYLTAVGHGRKDMADAIHAQMTQIVYAPPSTVTPTTIKLAARIAKITPLKDGRVFMTNGGSESVETALKISKQFHITQKEATRYKVISRRGSLHGGSYACTSLGSNKGPGMSAATDFGPLMPGSVVVPGPDNYRCLHCIPGRPHDAQGECSLEYAKDIERVINFEGASTVAAVVAEPISLSAGWHIPHPEYWSAVRKICDRNGVHLIMDEVLIGVGRTGKMFAEEHFDVVPDFITIAKALSGGYVPIGACVVTKKIADAFVAPNGAYFDHTFTYSGNGTASAAGMAALDIIESEGLVENSRKMGDKLYEKLQELRKYSIVGDVRGGKGLLTVIEFVKDRATKQSFPRETMLPRRIRGAMLKNGLIGRGANCLYVGPPLIISSDELDYLCGQLDKVIKQLDEELRA